MTKIQSLDQDHWIGSKYFYFSGRIFSDRYFYHIVAWCVIGKKKYICLDPNQWSWFKLWFWLFIVVFLIHSNSKIFYLFLKIRNLLEKSNRTQIENENSIEPLSWTAVVVRLYRCQRQRLGHEMKFSWAQGIFCNFYYF